MIKWNRVLSIGAVVVVTSVIYLLTDNSETRVIEDVLSHGLIRSTTDLKLITKSSGLRENAFLFEIELGTLTDSSLSRTTLVIEGASQPNSKNGLNSLRAILWRKLNMSFNDNAQSIWILQNQAQWSAWVYLIKDSGKYYLVIAYY